MVRSDQAPKAAAFPATPGLTAVGEIVRAERLSQRQAFEALDGKAGMILGCAGALIALAFAGPRWATMPATLAAAVSALHCLAVFRIENQEVLVPERARTAWLTADERRARLEILDTEIEIHRQMRAALDAKADRVKRARYWLVAALLTMAVGIVSPYVIALIPKGGEHLERLGTACATDSATAASTAAEARGHRRGEARWPPAEEAQAPLSVSGRLAPEASRARCGQRGADSAASRY